MDTSLSLISVIKLSLPFLGLLFLHAKMNRSKDQRAEQVLLPVLALLYSLAAMYGIYYVETQIESEVVKLVNDLPIVKDIIKRFPDINLGAYKIFILNTALVLGFIALKLFAFTLIKAFWNDKLTYEFSFCYEKLNKHPIILVDKDGRKISETKNDDEERDDEAQDDEGEDEEEENDNNKEKDAQNSREADDKKGNKSKRKEYIWCCKRKYEKFNILFKGFYIAIFVASYVIFVFSQLYPDLPLFKAAFYPVYGVLILGEVWFYLDGPAKPVPKCVKQKKTQTKKSFNKTPLELLRKQFHDLFKTRISYSEISSEAPDEVDTWLIPEEWSSRTASHNEKLAAAYFQKVLDSAEKDKSEFASSLNENYVFSALKLLQGQSILISNPFYRDLTDYLLLPMLRQILSFKKCLVIVGRDAAANDVCSWLSDAFARSAGTPNLWKTEILSTCQTEADTGILRANDIYNEKIQTVNAAFLKKVGFILVIEPSHILATGQLGLSLLVNRCEDSGNKMVYCAVDRNCDGLVDALSHTFKTSITEVTATIASTCNALKIYWHADGPYFHHNLEGLENIAHYLGMGTEFSLLALKNRVSPNVPATWISSDKFPVVDMKWIAGQYYKRLCSFANLPVSQAALESSFRFEPNLWFDKRAKEVSLTVEDEFLNLFEITRLFSSRASQLLLINVICEHYLLRDYMVDNVNLFLADAKAIPTIVPEFARTERNLILKLLVLMSHDPISESVIRREFEFCSVPLRTEQGEDTIKVTLQHLIQKHCPNAELKVEANFRSTVRRSNSEPAETTYVLKDASALFDYLETLKTAYFFTEDELGEDHYIAARLYGHVFQSFLVGQFITLDGKYYQVQSITSKNGVVLRRAADHINGRVYYRQLRSIELSHWETENSITVDGIERAMGSASFSISTSGYLEMSSWSDLKTAKTVRIGSIPKRQYKNKTALRITLPGVSERVRFTLCLLLNEIFRTTYPNSHQYICAVFPLGNLAPLQTRNAFCTFTGPCEPDSFYVLEDSDLDMGLTASVERNLKRYFEIVTDLLTWHFEKMAEKPLPLPQRVEPAEDELSEEEEQARLDALRKLQKKSLWQRIVEWFKRLFGASKPLESQKTSASVDESPVYDESEFNNNRGEDPSLTKYQERCFLRYGFDEFDQVIDLEGTLEYLSQFGFDHNPLVQARHNSADKDKTSHI